MNSPLQGSSSNPENDRVSNAGDPYAEMFKKSAQQTEMLAEKLQNRLKLIHYQFGENDSRGIPVSLANIQNELLCEHALKVVENIPLLSSADYRSLGGELSSLRQKQKYLKREDLKDLFNAADLNLSPAVSEIKGALKEILTNMLQAHNLDPEFFIPDPHLDQDVKVQIMHTVLRGTVILMRAFSPHGENLISSNQKKGVDSAHKIYIRMGDGIDNKFVENCAYIIEPLDPKANRVSVSFRARDEDQQIITIVDRGSRFTLGRDIKAFAIYGIRDSKSDKRLLEIPADVSVTRQDISAMGLGVEFTDKIYIFDKIGHCNYKIKVASLKPREPDQNYSYLSRPSYDGSMWNLGEASEE